MLHSPASLPLKSVDGQPPKAAKLAIAFGDPAGIGPELVLKSLQPEDGDRITVFGSRRLLQKTYDQLRSHRVNLIHPDHLTVVDVEVDPALIEAVEWGVGNAASGEISFQALSLAIAHTLAGEYSAIVTAPIAKSAWAAAGHAYPGQTELLAERAAVDRFGMLFVARSPHTEWTLRTLLATTHIPLSQVPTTLSPDLLTWKLNLLITTLQQMGIAQPRIAIAGLNPHSGEQGQLGREEADWMQPWLTQMRDRHPQAILEGLIPPDTLWIRPAQAWFGTASSAVAHDAYLALYHDQGLIPVKLMAFDQAVNTTIGLPFLRTSPDHGTAFDIAGRGIADAASFQAALRLAREWQGSPCKTWAQNLSQQSMGRSRE
jgi:4-hydroxythreonine-4-phosphate dehydrogenase